jgi:hypothetical protein
MVLLAWQRGFGQPWNGVEQSLRPCSSEKAWRMADNCSNVVPRGAKHRALVILDLPRCECGLHESRTGKRGGHDCALAIADDEFGADAARFPQSGNTAC